MEERRREGTPAPVRVEQVVWKCPECGNVYGTEADCAAHVRFSHCGATVARMSLSIYGGDRGFSQFEIHDSWEVPWPLPQCDLAARVCGGDGRGVLCRAEVIYRVPDSKREARSVLRRARTDLVETVEAHIAELSDACARIRADYKLKERRDGGRQA